MSEIVNFKLSTEVGSTLYIILISTIKSPKAYAELSSINSSGLSYGVKVVENWDLLVLVLFIYNLKEFKRSSWTSLLKPLFGQLAFSIRLVIISFEPLSFI